MPDDYFLCMYMYKATAANVTLPLLLKICNDRDNPSHTYYTHEDLTANLPCIVDYLDLCTL